MNPSTFPATNRSTQKNIWKTTTKGNSSSKKPNLHQLTLYWTAPTKALYFALKKNPMVSNKLVGTIFLLVCFWHIFSQLLRSNFAKKMGTPHPWWTAHITVAGTKSRQMIHGWSMDSRWFHAKFVGRSNLLSFWFLDPPISGKWTVHLGGNKQKVYISAEVLVVLDIKNTYDLQGCSSNFPAFLLFKKPCVQAIFHHLHQCILRFEAATESEERELEGQ